jgi:ParB-like chromosome segregation protein Spo0J
MKTKSVKPMQYNVHPIAKLFPPLSDEQYRNLVDDIKRRGQIQPILMKGSTLLDGLHRMQACEELKIAPRIDQYKGADEVGEILSRNLFRRHMPPDDYARIVIEARGGIDKLISDAQSRQKSGKPSGNGKGTDEVLKEQGVTHRTARDAVAIGKHGTEKEKQVLKPGAKERIQDVAREVKKRVQKKPGKSKTPVDNHRNTTKEFVVGRFNTFMDYWAVTHHRAVRKVLRDMLCPK